MARYIELDVAVAEVERLKSAAETMLTGKTDLSYWKAQKHLCETILSFLNTLEVKEFNKKNLYVITRCEEHSDYVEEVFFDEEKAQKYCDQFKGNENEYARHITKVKVTL